VERVIRTSGLVAQWHGTPVEAVCGVESRGFIFGAAMARAMKTGFVPLRKVGKLPPPTLGIDYDLEYGSARLEIGAEGVAPGARVLLVDDVLATGGTLGAGRRLLEQAGAVVIGASVVIEIDALGGRTRWPDVVPLHALLHFVRELRACPGAPALRSGDVVTTGTWTNAFAVAPGETWTARFDAPLSPLEVRFTSGPLACTAAGPELPSS
jgi:adenine phosphoribosyltransferase